MLTPDLPPLPSAHTHTVNNGNSIYQIRHPWDGVHSVSIPLAGVTKPKAVTSVADAAPAPGGAAVTTIAATVPGGARLHPHQDPGSTLTLRVARSLATTEHATAIAH